jgi:hypothetical protein
MVNTFLIWKGGEISDFELRLSYRLSASANSGIQYRSIVLDASKWVVKGYQADLEGGPNYTGILYEEQSPRGIMALRGEKVAWRGADCSKKIIGSIGTAVDLQKYINNDDWNEFIIIAKGNRLQHFINGKQMVDVTDECETRLAKKGVLALQLHVGKPMTAEFKDIRIKDLSIKPHESGRRAEVTMHDAK